MHSRVLRHRALQHSSAGTEDAKQAAFADMERSIEMLPDEGMKPHIRAAYFGNMGNTVSPGPGPATTQFVSHN